MILADQVNAVARLLERHLPRENALERARNIVQATSLRTDEDPPMDTMIRDIASGFGGGNIPNETIATIVRDLAALNNS